MPRMPVFLAATLQTSDTAFSRNKGHFVGGGVEISLRGMFGLLSCKPVRGMCFKHC